MCGARGSGCCSNVGGIFKHIGETLQTLSDADFLDAACFLPRAAGALDHMSNDEVQLDCGFAAFAGNFASSLVKARVRRTLYTSGYPHSFIPLLGTEQESQACVARIRQDYEIYETMRSIPTPSPQGKAFLERSPFTLLSMQQIVAALREADWQVSEPLAGHLRTRFSTLMQSQGVQDMNNFQKNARQHSNWGGRFRRPQIGLAVCVRRRLLQTVHKFDGVSAKGILAKAVEPLKKEDMCALLPPSIPCSAVASAQQRAPYWSPSAEFVGQPTADLEL